jgi:hypothetical protein
MLTPMPEPVDGRVMLVAGRVGDLHFLSREAAVCC